MQIRSIELAVAVSLVGCLGDAEQVDVGNQAAQGVGTPREVLICHVPPGNVGNAQTLHVASAAVRAHLAHGDRLGACEPTCAPEGGSCASEHDCCRGACVANVCTAVCVPGAMSGCYDGPVGTAGVGICSVGTRTCNADGSGYGPCTGEVYPGAEVCGDSLDNDCDGVADDGCVCEPGTTAACYAGPPGTEGLGACHAGTRTCNATGTAYGACDGAVVPTGEACGNGLDDDCDGDVDEGCLGDRAWQDSNQNGVQDPGEPGLPGVVFLLRDASTGALMAVAISNATGTYWFANVRTGDYSIEVQLPVGYTPSPPNAGSDDAVDSDFDPEVSATESFSYDGPSTGRWDVGAFLAGGT